MAGLRFPVWRLLQPVAGGSVAIGPDPSSGGLTTFPIDLSPLSPKPLSASEQAQSALGTGGPIVAGLPGLNQNSVVEMQGSPAVVQQGSVFSPVMVPLLSDTDPSIPHGAAAAALLRARAAGPERQTACEPSPTVTVVYDPAPQSRSSSPRTISRYVSQYSLQITAYDPPIFPDENLWGCVMSSR